MKKSIQDAIRTIAFCLLGIQTVWAQNYSDKEKAELASALPAAKIPLEKGSLMSEPYGCVFPGSGAL